MYRPVRKVLYSPSDMGLTHEKIALKTKDGLKIAAWYIPCENAKKTVLFCHGNGGNMAHRLDTINILNEMGLSCLIFDYRGFGSSQGKPSEKGTYLDAESAWDWLTRKKGIKPEDIIIFGRSLGGCIASRLAYKVRPCGLVVESAFTSYIDIGKKCFPYLPVKLFAKFRYNTLNYISRLKCPVLIMHSKADEIVSYEFAPKLFEAAPQPKQFVEILGCHNDGFLFSGDIYRNAWSNWIGEAVEKKTEKQKAS